MTGPNGRNSFDSADDDHLVEFIAKNNPSLSGRQGNKLYQKLEANENNQWPWSKYHSWQSWRERYRKNQDYFDRRIRKYQKRNKSDTRAREVVEEGQGAKKIATKPSVQSQLARDTTKEQKVVSERLADKVVPVESQEVPETPQGEAELMLELFGSYVEEENEPTEQHENEPASLKEPQHTSPQKNTKPEFVSKTPQSNLAPPPIPKKSRLEKLHSDEDPFGTPPPQRPGLLPPIRYVAPPTLVEGPFRKVLKRPRPATEDDSSWPPKRRNMTTEGLGEAVGVMPLPVVRPLTLPPNAIASSSKILPDPKPIVAAPEPAPVAALLQRNHDTQTVVASDSDPFASKQILNKIKGKGKALDIANVIATNSPPRIDLHRHSLQRRLNSSINSSSRRGSLLSTRSSTTAESHRSHNRKSRSLRDSISELDISDDGKVFALRAAQEMASKMARMARDHGVSTEIAMKTYTKTGSMEKTKVILEHFRKTLLAAEQEIYQRMPTIAHYSDDHVDTDGEVPDGLIPAPLDSAQASVQKSTSPQNKRPSSAKRRNPRPSLTVKPLPPDHDEWDTQSEYSPPTGSRAGQFVKLARRGRAEEALAREKHRVSLGAVPPTRSPEPKGVLPHAADVSPTPLSRAAAPNIVLDEQDDDDIYMRTDDEQQQSPRTNDEPTDEPPLEVDGEMASPSKQEQEIKELFPLHSITRKLIKRISGGRENDPTLLASAKEHRILALNVHTDNADEMRAFEAKHNSDLLRMWTMNMVDEMVAQNKRYSRLEAEIKDEQLKAD